MNSRKYYIRSICFILVFMIGIILPNTNEYFANAASNGSTVNSITLSKTSIATKKEVLQPKLTTNKLAIAKGKTTLIELENASGTVTFKSENASIAKVDSYGRITGYSEGTTNIYAIYKGVKYPCKVTVYKERISSQSKEITTYKNINLEVTLKDKKAWENLVVTSSNNNLAEAREITWKGDIATLPVIVKKEGTVEFTIKRAKSVETYSVVIHIINKQDRKALKATDLYANASESMVEITMVTSKEEDSLGSGFFIGKGMILTNYHVIEDATFIKVVDYSGKEYKVVSIYDYNKDYDLAVLGVEGTKTPLPIGEDSVVAGETVYTIGSPYGYTGTFSKGIVAAASRKISEIDYIQITSPISRGNSGGPLINRFGEVVGVNTLTRTDAQNVNFSVNISYLKKLDLTSPKGIETFLVKLAAKE